MCDHKFQTVGEDTGGYLRWCSVCGSLKGEDETEIETPEIALLFDKINEHGIQIEPEMGEDYQDEDGTEHWNGDEIEGWKAFPMVDGGTWGYGKTIQEAVDNLSLEEDE